MSRYQKKLNKILDNNYGVRSGVYSVIHPGIKMQMDTYGEYQPIFDGKETEEIFRKILSVDMMSDESPNEDELGRELFSSIKNIKHSRALGYYSELYAGHAIEGDFREQGSSGGLTTWILAELLRQKKIDGAIHVRAINPIKKDDRLFEYTISRSLKEIKEGAKSRYYPMELSGVLGVVKKVPGKYAIVGIPEFITELRLLADVDPIIKDRIAYMIGIICGHQKTAKYAEALAWQHGIKPGCLLAIDFRIKQPESTAMDYLHKFTGLVEGKSVTLTKKHHELLVDNWGAGFFKSKFSDFTDNAFNELADVVLGDAWIPEYNSDGMGNNIVIVRNKEISGLLRDGMRRNALKLDDVNEQTIIESQQGLIHHTLEELPIRLSQESHRRGWVPKKRTKPSTNGLNVLRRSVQKLRYSISTRSHKTYKRAVELDSWGFFEKAANKQLKKYRNLYHLIGLIEKENTAPRLWCRALQLNTKMSRPHLNIRARLRIHTRLHQLTENVAHRIQWLKYKTADGAIITLNGYFNYGNIIQRYALQEYLRQKGRNFISYENAPTNVSWDNSERFGNTLDFVNRNISRKKYDRRDRFPAYIVGSDQVWRNWGYADEIKDLGYFFLDFVNDSRAKRVAYAASFGKDSTNGAKISQEFIEYARPLVKRFDAIYMREKSGVDVLSETWGARSRQVVDPTMLLSAKDYSELIKKSPHRLKSTRPIFTYILHSNEWKMKVVKKIAQDVKKDAAGFYLDQLKELPPVEQWLKGFRDAELIVTDSFHGAVFSIINNKPFVVLDNDVGGTARITSLLEEFGITNRFVTDGKAENIDISKIGPINWVDVNIKLEVLRERSGLWLLSSLNQGKIESKKSRQWGAVLTRRRLSDFTGRARRWTVANIIRYGRPLVPQRVVVGMTKVARKIFFKKIIVSNVAHAPGRSLVSVVTPYYNCAKTIQETMDSVLNQTFQNFEYIIVDDGSSKQDARALDKINHPKIKVVHLEKNIGNGSPGAARNVGILMAKGKYVVCLDADDILEPTYLEKGVVALETHPWLGLFSTNTNAFGVTNEQWNYADYEPLELFRNNMITTAAMFRKDIWQELGGYKENIGYEDWEMWINMAEHGHFAFRLKERLFRYRTAESSRFTEDRKKHESIVRDIRNLHPHYNSTVRVLRHKARRKKHVFNDDTAFINLSKKGWYKQENNKNNPNVLIAMPWMTFGGAETLIVNFCKEIRHRYNLSFVTGLNSDHKWEYKFQEITPNIFHLANLFNDKKMYLQFLSNYIAVREISILHIIHTDFMFDILDELKRRHPDLKVITTVFNDRAHFHESIAASEFVDVYTTDNSAVQKHYQRVLNETTPTKPVEVIPNGINSERIFNPERFNRAEMRAGLGLDVDDLAVFFIGRLSKEKNPDVFVEAATRVLSTETKNIKFFVIGDGNMHKEIESKIKKTKYRENISYLGYKSNIAEHLSAADVFVLPSSTEGFPLSILEAMAMRVVVVASDVGAVADVIESGVDGFVVEPGSAEQIEKAIFNLYNNSRLLNDMKLRSRKKVEVKYSNIILGKNYTNLYKETLK